MRHHPIWALSLEWQTSQKIISHGESECCIYQNQSPANWETRRAKGKREAETTKLRHRVIINHWFVVAVVSRSMFH